MSTTTTSRCDPGRWAAVVGALDCETCAAITEFCQSMPSTTPTVVGQAELPDQRVGRVHRIERSDKSAELYNLLWELGCGVNDRHFELDLTGIEKSPEYVEYPAGMGHFDWHNDYGLERPLSRRKLTISIQLTESDDYVGGDFEVFGTPEPLPRERGTVIVLPAYVQHRVTRVTSGTRRALVAWLAGPALR